MPIDYRRNLSTPKNKCPQSMEMRLRDPKCRNEMKDRPHKNPHDKPVPPTPDPPTPDPPKPDPPDPRPKPPRPDPKPQPNPKPDFNAPRPIPYHTSSSMPVSATGMAIGGASAGIAYGAYNSAKIANLTRGYRSLGEVRATPNEPVEDIPFAEPAETELTDVMPRASARTLTQGGQDVMSRAGLRTTSFQAGESLEAGTDVARESGSLGTGTAGQTPSTSTMTSSNAPSASYETEDLDFAPDFADAKVGFEEQAERGLANIRTGGGVSTLSGEGGGIEMADLGGQAVAEAGGEAGAEALADLGASAEAGADVAGAGGGGVNPIADVVGAGIMAVGLGVSIGQLIGGAIEAHDKYVANEFNKMSGTQKLSDTQLQGMISKLNIDQANAKNNKQITAIQKQIDQLNNVIKSGQQGVVYTDANGNQQIAFTLSNADLSKAIKTYQTNPNAFKGLDATQLEIMGLNPSMAKGSGGAKGFDKNGVYTPKGSYDTKNIANNYLAPNRQNTIKGQSGINSGFNEAITPQAKDAYEKQFEDKINSTTNSADKTALTLQYNAWRASQGMDTYGDQQIIQNLNKEFKQGKISQSELISKTQALMASIKAHEAEAGTKWGEYQQEQYKARMLAEANQEQTIGGEENTQLEQQLRNQLQQQQAQNQLSTLSQLQTNLDNQKATFTAQGSSALIREQTQTNNALNQLQSGIDRMNTMLEDYQNQANTYTSQGKPVPQNLSAGIAGLQQNIKVHQQMMTQQQQFSQQMQQNIMKNTNRTLSNISQSQARITAKTAQAQAVINNAPTTGNQTQSAPKPATTNNT